MVGIRSQASLLDGTLRSKEEPQSTPLLGATNLLHYSIQVYHMPLGVSTSTATATTVTMSQSQTSTAGCYTQNTSRSPSPSNDAFSESRCLFCPAVSASLDSNLTHMSKFHGLHLDLANLLVDITTLLQYFYLVIAEECLYCGTHRSNRQAVQQHMLAKGHCKYNREDPEFADFYETPESDEHNVDASRPDQVMKASKAHSRRAHPDTTATDTALGIQPRRRDRAEIRNAAPSTANSNSNTNSSPSSTNPTSDVHQSSPSSPPSNRAAKLQDTLNTTLSQLSASDRATLAHLPPAQQRAVLATQARQLATAQRSEKTKRTRLETAHNHGGRLDSIRLKRVPPHFGCVGSLNR